MSERDGSWFDELYNGYHLDIVRYGVRRTADVDTAADLAQEVFVVAWRRRDQVPDNSLPWLYGVARRLLANHRRAQHRAPLTQPFTDLLRSAQADHPDSVAALTDLATALGQLADIDQEILRLIGWEQLTIDEAATVLACSRTAAKVRLHRARRRLAAVLSATAAPPPTAAPARARPMAQLTNGAHHAQH
jgi:RNA polymerase sigma-70 factor (ECF subfamily)